MSLGETSALRLKRIRSLPRVLSGELWWRLTGPFRSAEPARDNRPSVGGAACRPCTLIPPRPNVIYLLRAGSSTSNILRPKMSLSGAESLDALRSAVEGSNRENTRCSAALMGSAIAQISWTTQDDPAIRVALAAVRTACLELLEELTRDQTPETARQRAFQAVDGLTRLLVEPAPAIPSPLGESAYLPEEPAHPAPELKVTSTWRWRIRRA
jgi:hypothetical protein